MQFENCGLTENDVDKLNQNEKDLLLRALLKENRKLKSGVAWVGNDNTYEKFTPDLEYSVPYLSVRSDLGINTGALLPANHLILGENYHAMRILQHKYKGYIGFVYCDVPYNIGTNFMFSGQLVEATDAWRHSKWLSFMDKRMRLIKSLITQGGVVAVSISDTECARLVLLMDEIFGEKNRISISPVIVNKGGKKAAEGIAVQHEYLVIYTNNYSAAIDRLAVAPADLIDEGESTSGYSKTKTFVMPTPADIKYQETANVTHIGGKRPFCDNQGPFSLTLLTKNGSDSLKSDRPSMHFPIYYVPCTPENLVLVTLDKRGRKRSADDSEVGSAIDPNPQISLTPPNVPHIEIFPLKSTKNEDRRWRWGRDRIEQFITDRGDNSLVARYDADGQVQLYLKSRDKFLYKNASTGEALQAKVVKSIFDKTEYSTAHGSNRLTEILGPNTLDYAKPVALLEDLIMMFSGPDDIIADFFAKSGVTGEAVVSVNSKYTRNNRFILVTDNDEMMGEKVTVSRLKLLNDGVFLGGKLPVAVPLPMKVLVYDLGVVDSRYFLEPELAGDYVQPEIVDIFPGAAGPYSQLVYGVDTLLYASEKVLVQVNTYDKILVITEFGKSALGSMRDPELYEYINQYLSTIGDYTKVLVQYGVDDTAKGVDFLTESNRIHIITYPMEYLRALQFSAKDAIIKGSPNFKVFQK